MRDSHPQNAVHRASAAATISHTPARELPVPETQDDQMSVHEPVDPDVLLLWVLRGVSATQGQVAVHTLTEAPSPTWLGITAKVRPEEYWRHPEYE